MSTRRATADAIMFFRRAIEAAGVFRDEVTTDGAAALPPIAHATGKAVQQRIARDHQHLQGRPRPLRGFKTLAGARVLCRGHALRRNLRAASTTWDTRSTPQSSRCSHRWRRRGLP